MGVIEIAASLLGIAPHRRDRSGHWWGCRHRIEGNSVTDSPIGLEVDFAGNLIIGNSASGNTSNYEIVVGNKVGVIVDAPDSVAISGSTGGAGVGTTNSWANFSF